MLNAAIIVLGEDIGCCPQQFKRNTSILTRHNRTIRTFSGSVGVQEGMADMQVEPKVTNLIDACCF